jgi:hypothetical protein
MKKMMVKTRLIGVILGCLSATGLTGCVTSAYINPFTYLSGVLSTDNTDFFVDIYTALLSGGATTTTTTTTTGS